MLREVCNNPWIELVILMGFLAPIIVEDIRFKRIPDVLILPAIGVFVLKRVVYGEDQVYRLLLCGSWGFGFILALNFLFRGKIGLGDGKLSALLAIVFGFQGWLVALFIASSVGLLYGGLMMKCGCMKRDERIPYAPFLALGGLVSFFVQNYLFMKAGWVWRL
jgi:leader peptidase (prepilin peptidase)/N-methyltransferase